MHNRMKEALVMMASSRARWRARPLVKIAQVEIEGIEALIAAGLLDRAGRSLRAA